MPRANVLVLELVLALAACGDDDSLAIDPWPIPIAGDLDAGRRLDASRDAAPDADAREAGAR